VEHLVSVLEIPVIYIIFRELYPDKTQLSDRLLWVDCWDGLLEDTNDLTSVKVEAYSVKPVLNAVPVGSDHDIIKEEGAAIY